MIIGNKLHNLFIMLKKGEGREEKRRGEESHGVVDLMSVSRDKRWTMHANAHPCSRDIY